DRPANAFVAAFIGNPPMNVFPVRARASERNGLQLTVADQVVSLPNRPVPLPPGEQPLCAGLRPEAFALAGDTAEAPRLTATVEHGEFLGHETLAHVAIGDLRLVVRFAGMQPLSKDAQVRLTFDPERLHLFDESGQAL